MRRGRLFALGLTAAFLAAESFLATRHEMWRDEVEGWLIARDSGSIAELVRNMRYVGHPMLWQVLLMPLATLNRSPAMMQPLNLLVAGTTVLTFARFSPFTTAQKILFAFGYFSLYEYTIVCRQYGMGVLLICLVGALFPRRYERPIWLGTVLLFLSQVSVHTVIVAISVTAGLVLDWILLRRRRSKTGLGGGRRALVGLGLSLAGVILAVVQMVPPADTGYAEGWLFRLDPTHLRDVICLINRAFLPIPNPGLHFYWEQWLDNAPLFQQARFPVACVLLAWCVVVLLRRPVALLTYLVGTVGLLAFFYVKLLGDTNHHGFLFLIFVLALWMGRYTAAWSLRGAVDRIASVAEKTAASVLTTILVVHLAGGVLAAALETKYAFSMGKETAKFMVARGLKDAPMLGDDDYAAQTVLGYLGKDRAYYLRGARFGSFVIWNKARTTYPGDEVLISVAREQAREARRDAILVMNRELPEPLLAGDAAPAEIARFVGAAVPDENYYLYRVPAPARD